MRYHMVSDWLTRTSLQSRNLKRSAQIRQSFAYLPEQSLKHYMQSFQAIHSKQLELISELKSILQFFSESLDEATIRMLDFKAYISVFIILAELGCPSLASRLVSVYSPKVENVVVHVDTIYNLMVASSNRKANALVYLLNRRLIQLQQGQTTSILL